jgi:diguanylate cyclase (GGDEF)-like protein
MENDWWEELLRCAEGMYILEEKSKKIVWTNNFFTDTLKKTCVREPCWKAILKRETPCPFCPSLSEQDDVYAWDYYEPQSRRWMKVKHLVFRRRGILYRAGNINIIDDMMRLNYETVQEISLLQAILAKNQNTMVSLTKEAIYDTLTGLFNRNCFQMDLEQNYSKASGIGILYFDLNNLKLVNDAFCHTAGDELLKRMAEVLRLVCTQTENAKCYRIGGDEFVLMLAYCTEEALAYCAELFMGYMEDYNRGREHSCSVALGQAFSKGPCDLELLVSQADRDMYQCKQKMKDIMNDIL